MPKEEKASDLLEWTVHDEFGLERGQPLPDPPAPPEPAPRRVARGQWVLLAAVAGVVALLPWLYARWEWWQTRGEVERQVAAEAASTGEVTPPLRLLTPVSDDVPILRDLEQIDANTLRAEVDRRFTTPDGQTVTFAITRFYRRVGEAWQTTAAPGGYPGDVGLYTSPLLKISYYLADAKVIEEKLIPYLESVLGQACAEWRCRAGDPAALNFVDAPRTRRNQGGATAVDADDPLVIALLKVGDLAPADLRLGAPHELGYPVDQAGVEFWQRTAAVKALVQLADRAGPAGERAEPLLRNAYFFALITRAAARLGVEATGALTYTREVPAETMAVLWEETQTGRSGLRLPQATEGALAVLNSLLRDQPVTVEVDLLRGLRRGLNYPDPAVGWLIRALRPGGMSANDFYDRLQAVAGRAASTLPPPAEIDFALSCSSGPQISVAGQLRPLPPFDASASFVWGLDWSPDGRRLALNTFLQTTVLDLETGDLFWPPVTAPDAEYAFPALWMSDTLLAYSQFSSALLEGPFDPALIQLFYVDIDEPARVLPGPQGVLAYSLLTRPAPDRSALALTLLQADGGFGAFGPLALIGALDQAPTPVAEAASLPAWSPDSRQIAFAQLDADGRVTLQVRDAGSPTGRLIWSSPASGLTRETPIEFVDLDWSRDADWIALAVGSGREGWLVLAQPDGVRRWRASDRPTHEAVFSPDGRWLATVQASEQLEGSRVELVIFDLTQNRAVVQREGNWGELYWSPRDSQLLAFRDGNVYLFTDPLGEPQWLAADCMDAAWRP